MGCGIANSKLNFWNISMFVDAVALGAETSNFLDFFDFLMDLNTQMIGQETAEGKPRI